MLKQYLLTTKPYLSAISSVKAPRRQIGSSDVKSVNDVTYILSYVIVNPCLSSPLGMIDTAKYLGVWMDHQNANLMEFTRGPISTRTIDSKFTHAEKEQTLARKREPDAQ